MTSMESLLTELNEAPGVRGSAVTTADGMVVRSAQRDRSREDVVSGLTSFLISTTCRAFEEASRERAVDRFVVHATHGKLVVVSIGEAFLVVITDQFAMLDGVLDVVDDIAGRLRNIVSLVG